MCEEGVVVSTDGAARTLTAFIGGSRGGGGGGVPRMPGHPPPRSSQ